MADFVIYALPLANGILGIAPLPGRGNHTVEDLEHLHDWKPALVISLTTAEENEAQGVADLGSSVQDRGTRWVHFPVTDMSVPKPDQAEDWVEIERIALAALHGGGRVLVHCLGGCGRSGMAALRLMIQVGEAPEDALSRLRGVRPCAVETVAQMDWARGVTRRLNLQQP